MLKIKRKLLIDEEGSLAYELENGILLHEKDWKDVKYIKDGIHYLPVTESDNEGNPTMIGFDRRI